MKRFAQLTLLTMTLAIIGCSTPDHYPISGQECGPNDPVKDLSAADCTIT